MLQILFETSHLIYVNCQLLLLGCSKSRIPSRGFDQIAVISEESPRSRTGFARKWRNRKGHTNLSLFTNESEIYLWGRCLHYYFYNYIAYILPYIYIVSTQSLTPLLQLTKNDVFWDLLVQKQSSIIQFKSSYHCNWFGQPKCSHTTLLARIWAQLPALILLVFPTCIRIFVNAFWNLS